MKDFDSVEEVAEPLPVSGRLCRLDYQNYASEWLPANSDLRGLSFQHSSTGCAYPCSWGKFPIKTCSIAWMMEAFTTGVMSSFRSTYRCYRVSEGDLPH